MARHLCLLPLTICMILFTGICRDAFANDNVEDHPLAQSLRKQIEEFSREHHRAMTDEEFQQLLSSKEVENNLPTEDLPLVHEMLRYLVKVNNSVRPAGPYSIEDIHKVLVFRRDSITSLDVSFVHTMKFDKDLSKGLMDSKHSFTTTHIRFAKEFDKTRYSEFRYAGEDLKSLQPINVPYTIGYDGKNVFSMSEPSQTQEGAVDYGSVSEEYHEGDYYQHGYWPTIGGLLGNPSEETAQPFYCDLIEILETGATLYVEPEYAEINGVQTVVVKYGSPHLNAFYLDPSRGFCPIRVEVPGEKNGIGYLVTMEFSDFEKSENGIYLPGNVITLHQRKSDNGKYITYCKEEYIVDNLSVNEDINDDLFVAKGIFKDGTIIEDWRMQFQYTYGATIEDIGELMADDIHKTANSVQLRNDNIKDNATAGAQIDNSRATDTAKSGIVSQTHLNENTVDGTNNKLILFILCIGLFVLLLIVVGYIVVKRTHYVKNG